MVRSPLLIKKNKCSFTYQAIYMCDKCHKYSPVAYFYFVNNRTYILCEKCSRELEELARRKGKERGADMSFDDLIDDCVVCGKKGILVDIVNGEKIFMCHKCYVKFLNWLEKRGKCSYGAFIQDDRFRELLDEYLRKKTKKALKVKLLLT